MRTTVLLTLLATGAIAVICLSFARPYLPDLWRFAWWRVLSPPALTGEVNSGDASIHYRVSGQGEPLLLLHGGLSSSLDWYAQLPELSRHFKVVSIDSRGHGQSTLGHQTYGYSLLADDVIAVMDELRIADADIAGWSDGGNIAQLLARNQPKRDRRVMAISANAHPDGLTRQASELIQGIDPEKPPLLMQALYFFQSPHPSRLVRLRREVLSMWQRGPHFSCEDLNSISAPVALMIGENDDIARGHAEQMLACLQHGSLDVLSSVGHSVPQSAPGRVLTRMLQFFGEEHRGH